jgi:hypothetical protein
MSAFSTVIRRPTPINMLFNFTLCKKGNIHILNFALDVIKNTFRGSFLLAFLANSDIKQIVFIESNDWTMHLLFEIKTALIRFPDFFNDSILSRFCLVKDNNVILKDLHPYNKVIDPKDFRFIAAVLYHELYHVFQLTENILLNGKLKDGFPNLLEQNAVEIENLIRRELKLSYKLGAGNHGGLPRGGMRRPHFY